MLEQARLIDWSSLQFFLMWIYEAPPHSGKIFTKRSEFFSMWLIRKGSVEITADGRTLRASEGQWVVRELGPCSQEFSPDAEILSVNFGLHWPTGEDFLNVRKTVIFEADRYPRLEVTARHLLRLVESQVGKAFHVLQAQRVDLHVFLDLQRELLNWVGVFVDTMTQEGMTATRLGITDARIIRATKLLNQWPLDTPIEQSLLAKEAGVTIQHLDRLFAKELHMSPGRYFEARRLGQAKRCLATTSDSIKETAFRLGFRSESHFSRWFKQHESVSPTVYRKNSIAALV